MRNKKNVRFFRCFVVVAALLTSFSYAGAQKGAIVPADMQFAKYVPSLKGKRVALLVNNTAVVGKTHLADTLAALHVNLVKIFSPEHGFRGNTPDGEDVNEERDKRTGLPVISLYGNNKKATPEQMADVDVVIYDIQDVGVRFYTYISSLHYMMESCAETGKKLIVLDRPNPNSGITDGPIWLPAYKSFVGMHPIPIAYGMTIGELARMINGESWLANGEKCELEVIPVSDYQHGKAFPLAIKPSPNLTTDHAVAMYPYICLFEGTVISLGRGTHMPFEILGNPELKGMPFQFTPQDIPDMSLNPPHKGELCYGLDLRNEKPEQKIALHYVISMYNAYPEKDKFFKKYFDTLAGTGELKKQIEAGLSEDAIRATWKPGLDAFKAKRKKYLLYK